MVAYLFFCPFVHLFVYSFIYLRYDITSVSLWVGRFHEALHTLFCKPQGQFQTQLQKYHADLGVEQKYHVKDNKVTGVENKRTTHEVSARLKEILGLRLGYMKPWTSPVFRGHII